MSGNLRKIIAALLLIPAVCVISIISHLTGSEKQEPVSKDSFYFDTTCSIAVYDSSLDEEAAMAQIEKAFALCREYEDLLSKTIEGSDIWKINHAGGKAVAVDPRTMECIKDGLEYCRQSDGRFDISIGRVVDLWDYHDENARPPAKARLTEALETVGYENVILDEKSGTVTVPGGMELDLGGIAKGYIADRVCEMLADDDVAGALVNFGGNIECVGDKFGEPFKIGIERPYTDRSEIIGTTPVTNGTITTSGVYERFFEYRGRKYHHILNTKTGMPVDTDLLSVTVSGGPGTSADCDALATICLILGHEKGKALIESTDGVEAMFILADNSTDSTEGFELE